MYTLEDINIPIKDDNIYIDRIETKKENKMTKYEEIKNAIENGNYTAEELGMLIGNYLSSNAMNAESKLGSEIEKEGIMMTSFINTIKESDSFSDDFKKRCIKTIMGELEFLEEALDEVKDKAEEVEEYLRVEEEKEMRIDKWKNIAKIAIGVATVVATAVTAYKVYKKFNPGVITLEIDDMPTMDV